MIRSLLLILVCSASFAWAATPKPGSKKAANPNTKNHNFDSQVVEGEVYRPDYSVVTGEAPGEGWGVLRLRPDFDDHAASDRAEKQSTGKKQ